jgi:hypothetical protein
MGSKHWGCACLELLALLTKLIYSCIIGSQNRRDVGSAKIIAYRAKARV